MITFVGFIYDVSHSIFGIYVGYAPILEGVDGIYAGRGFLYSAKNTVLPAGTLSKLNLISIDKLIDTIS